ncbi:iron-containing alcohol dehydrogenase [Cereibacter sphaeroides]|uniref:Alcohol dehydrogenase 2 n=1 Tax=Cereibacter sphaeroides TaxID=1063 RepID=A0AAX1UJI5_CERSP|nr:1-propanol dehydrogenase PduQ [Cereibacter sphaeroides]AZB71219.1 iron-containing alcohol dehydrogenase [Cereibacter sphaeroides]RHZ93649.1 iron-containing alcohol dehydrogenase [Cereibacter sphaeroides]
MTRYQSFSPRTEIVFGEGLLDRLHAYRGQRIGIVTDEFMARSGPLERVLAHLEGCTVEIFAEAIAEPPLSTVASGARLFIRFRPDVVLALGGGSPIDAAKAILAVVRNADPGHPIRLVAIPTTSGTGSEVTAFAVISDPDNDRKFPLISADLVPDVAILDPEFVRTAPPKVTADTGMDVITHAIEAVVARGASHFSDAFAEKALELAFPALPRAYDNGNDLAARDAMHQASCLAGMAFTEAGLGINHGLAHAIGGQLHLVHGRINAVLLPHVIAWNAGLEDDAPGCRETAGRYARIAQRVGLDVPGTRAGVIALIRAIEALNQRFGIPSSLRGLGVAIEEYRRAIPDLAAAAFADACTAGNPRRPGLADLARILDRAGG